jgi:MFS family permease
VLAGVEETAREITPIALQLPAGALADRPHRRLTMIICDSMRAALIVVLCVLVAAHLASWPVVLVVSMIEGGTDAIFDPSATAALPAIVPDRQIEEAWAATEARTYGTWLVGPALGGVLFGLGRAAPFLADAVSYGVSLGTVSRIRGRFRLEKATERRALWREVGDGLRIVRQVPVLRATMVQGPLAGLLVEHVSGTWAIGAFAAAQAVAAVLCLTMSGLRQAESLAAAPAGSPQAGSG